METIKYFLKGILMIPLLPIMLVINIVVLFADFIRNPYDDYSQEWLDKEKELKQVY